MDERRLVAIRDGKTRYRGSPCKYCNEEIKYAGSGRCCQCTKTYEKKLYDERSAMLRRNKEKLLLHLSGKSNDAN